MADYRGAAKMHYEDGEHLEEDRRFCNADQLYGLAAECVLKALMIQLGATTLGSGEIADYALHIDKLWPEFKTFLAGRDAAKLSADLPPGSPFRDFSVEQRYEGTNIPAKVRVAKHREAAGKLRELLTKYPPARVKGTT